MNTLHLYKRAVALFPRTPYTDPNAVRALRRGWIRAVSCLRSVEPSKWVVDNKVQRSV
jgi:hypothetical protein